MNLGGNLVNNLGSQLNKSFQFCDDAYSYSAIVLKQGEVHDCSPLASARVYLLQGSVRVNDHLLEHSEESVQVENLPAGIRCVSAEAKILLVGSKKSVSDVQQIQKYSAAELKKVEKPWGYEIWITGEHPQYCLKKIFIKSGTRTSLQYHNQKRETNVLFEGQAKLHYKKENNVAIQDVTETDIASHELKCISVIDVFPLTIHRLEAVSDILLYEASTPQLDDVVRISDDSKRGHGRIQSEHDKK